MIAHRGSVALARYNNDTWWMVTKLTNTDGAGCSCEAALLCSPPAV